MKSQLILLGALTCGSTAAFAQQPAASDKHVNPSPVQRLDATHLKQLRGQNGQAAKGMVRLTWTNPQFVAERAAQKTPAKRETPPAP